MTDQDCIPYAMLNNTATLSDAIKWIVKNELSGNPKMNENVMRSEISSILWIVITEIFKVTDQELAALIFEEWKSVDDNRSRY